MALSTYSELKTSIAGWLNREDADTIAKIPDFIALAEAKISRDVRHWRQEKRVTTNLNEQYENLPNDWLGMIQMQLTQGGKLQAISANELQNRKQLNRVAGKPQFYRLTANQLELYPIPNVAYEASMQYYARVPALSDQETFNWVLIEYPDIYLYGSLIHAAPYLIDDQRINVWASLYQSAIDTLNQDDTKSRVSGPLRMGIPR